MNRVLPSFLVAAFSLLPCIAVQAAGKGYFFKGKPAALSAPASQEMHSQSINVQSGDPAPFLFWGKWVITEKDEMDKLGDLLGPALSPLPHSQIDETRATLQLPDIAPDIASSIQRGLIARYAMHPVADGRQDAATYSINVTTQGWQVYRTSIASDLWFTYIANMRIVANRNNLILVQGTCSFRNTNAAKQRPYVLTYLSNEMQALKSDLADATTHCVDSFLGKALRQS